MSDDQTGTPRDRAAELHEDWAFSWEGWHQLPSDYYANGAQRSGYNFASGDVGGFEVDGPSPITGPWAIDGDWTSASGWGTNPDPDDSGGGVG